MPGKVYVLPLWTPPENRHGIVVSTVSKNDSELSPFKLGPCRLYHGYKSQTMENAWQYSKLYECHAQNGRPTSAYWKWAQAGWKKYRAERYPMGKGAIPLCSWWKAQPLNYIEARKTIYGPLYIRAVRETLAYRQLRYQYLQGETITLLDYDAYDHRAECMSLRDVLNNPNKKMGHAFVLAMLLTKDLALEEMKL